MSQKNTEALKKTKMSTIGVIALIYSFIAAGAFGIEEAIAASGPGVTLAMLFIFPFIWSFPLCEMIGELGSIYPTEGGIYSWGREAFGEFWGWQVGLWSAITTWLCQAQYCALVAGYAAKIVPLTPTTEYIVKIVVILLFTIINIMGLDWLEKFEIFFIALVLAAFAAVTIVGFMNWNYNPIEPFFNEEVGLFQSVGGGIAIIIWMFCGYECMSNMAGEIVNPQVIPRALRLSQPLIALSYILPTLAGLAAIGSWSAWSTESGGGNVGYADVLIQYVGSWGGVLFVIIAIIANCAIFSSYIAHGSRAFFVMADDNMFPKIMKKVDKRGVPSVAIILLAIFTFFMCEFDFVTLVMATTPIQLFLYLMVIACVVMIRKRYPVEGREKMGLAVMPGGTVGLVLLSGCVFFVSMFALYANGADYFIAAFAVLGLGLPAYLLCKWIYKGRALDDSEIYPLNPKTKLGLGDLIDIGVYTFLSGAMAIVGAIFFSFYYDSAEFYIDLCKWMGIALIVLGAIIWIIGRKTEGLKLKELQERRNKELDDRIRALHGAIPSKVCNQPINVRL